MDKYESAVALWKSFNVKTESDIDLRLDSFRVLFAFNSGKIENDKITYHDTREIFENGEVKGFSGDPRAIFEQQNQKLCYEYLKSKIIAKEPLSIPLILEVHKILTSGTYDEKRFLSQGERPGEFKKHDYVTGRYEVGSAPEDVESDLTELLGEVNDAPGKDVLTVAAYFHVSFEHIHPFADGNGRVGRTLLNYYLMINDYPPVVIYDEDKTAYYNALEAYDKDEQIESMRTFIKGQTVKTWEKSLERQKKRDSRDER